MPKKIDVKGLQSIRLAHKQKVQKYTPSTVYLQVVGSGAEGGPRALYVFTEHTRYLFNCGEGVQRLACEHKVKLGKLEHVLVTHKSWHNVGGLPGMLLTLQDIGVPHITLHGPPGIDSLYENTQHFMRFRDLSIQYHHYQQGGGTFGGANEPLTIKTVPLWAVEEQPVISVVNGEVEALEEGEDLFAHERGSRKRPNSEGDQADQTAAKRLKLEESVRCRSLALAYVCRPPPKAGTLYKERCVAAGVPAGPLLGELKQGRDVVLPDGRLVRAADVRGPDDPGPVFMVVEAPSEGFVEALVGSEVLAQHRGETEVVVHFTPQHVVEGPQYQAWMATFPSSTSHLFINEASSCLGSLAVHRIQHKLHQLSPSLFPLLADCSIPLSTSVVAGQDEGCTTQQANSSSSSSRPAGESKGCTTQQANNSSREAGQDEGCTTQQAATLMTYHIRPRKGLDRTNLLERSPESYVAECGDNEAFEPAVHSLKSQLAAFSRSHVSKFSQAEHPIIEFLGTGSAVPNKTRNTSGILLHLSEDKCVLLECSEGTYGQLVRLQGLQAAGHTLRRMLGVYVSHLHADHHIGFIKVLQARKQAFQQAGVHQVPPLLLLAPDRIMPYLKSYHVNFEPILDDFRLVNNQSLLSGEVAEEEEYRSVCGQLDMEKIETTRVIHCPQAYGVALTHLGGWKLVYSGDTMPSPQLVHIGQDCDVLIHEATMEDELEDEARMKRHSTTSQAIQVGQDMNARYTLLTHFSQRYAKVPLLKHLPQQVGIAFDNMRVRLGELGSLHFFYDALVAMFSDHYDEMLGKTAKKLATREKAENS